MAPVSSPSPGSSPVAMDMIASSGAGASGPGQAGGSDQIRGQLDAMMGAIRDLGQQVSQIGQQLPAAQPEVQQIQQILRRIIAKAGQASPSQNGSADALPG